jgi:hypothetical protein
MFKVGNSDSYRKAVGKVRVMNKVVVLIMRLSPLFSIH